MHVLAIDDEKLALENLIFSLREALPDAEVHGFITPEGALEFAGNLHEESDKPLDFAFLDVVMSTLSGLEVAVRLKKIFPDVRIIFVTGYSDYAYDAYRLHAKGYILKPVSKALIQEELDHLDLPQKVKWPLKRVQVHTFRSKTSEFFTQPCQGTFSISGGQAGQWCYTFQHLRGSVRGLLWLYWK